ncbi:hypothetical protein ACFY0B_03325, partial [Streptomyces sp. NPDC001797]|uniref:hypothetical protein n=1 Tax=Streptomyces sp. NPDC001797 TaxID=3364610 RepID=UPI0036BCF0A1
MADDATEPEQRDQTASHESPRVNAARLETSAHSIATFAATMARVQRQIGTDHFASLAAAVAPLARSA